MTTGLLFGGEVPVRVCYHTQSIFAFRVETSTSFRPHAGDPISIFHPSNRQISPVPPYATPIEYRSYWFKPQLHQFQPQRLYRKLKTYTQAKLVVIMMVSMERTRIFVSKTPESEDPSGRVDRPTGRPYSIIDTTVTATCNRFYVSLIPRDRYDTGTPRLSVKAHSYSCSLVESIALSEFRLQGSLLPRFFFRFWQSWSDSHPLSLS